MILSAVLINTSNPRVVSIRMVLKNSKWDKKAKFQYMKKHGLARESKKPEKPVQKWSSKARPQVVEDDEWDSENDEQLLNHFYPLIGEDNLTKDQKIKIKWQIINELREKMDSENEPQYQEEEIDGIYLGPPGEEPRKPQETTKDVEEEESSNKFNLREYLDNLDNGSGNRKLLSNKMTTNFLEEYGFDNYAQITRTEDDLNDMYNAKKQNRGFKNIPTAELDGFVVGETDLSKPAQNPSHIRELTKEEMEQDEQRKNLDQKSRFIRQMKNKFGENPQHKLKVLEVNNFNNNDEELVSRLNEKIAREDEQVQTTTFDEDLDALLGSSKSSQENQSTAINTNKAQLNLDDLMSDLSIEPKPKLNSSSSSAVHSERKTAPKPQTPLNDQDFLDSILQ